MRHSSNPTRGNSQIRNNRKRLDEVPDNISSFGTDTASNYSNSNEEKDHPSKYSLERFNMIAGPIFNFNVDLTLNNERYDASKSSIFGKPETVKQFCK